MLHGDGPLRPGLARALGPELVHDVGDRLDALVVLGDPGSGGDLDEVLDRAFLAPVRAIRAALPALNAGGGQVLVVVGPEARIPRPGHAPAAAAAHALRGLGTTLEIEFSLRRGARTRLLETEAVADVLAALER